MIVDAKGNPVEKCPHCEYDEFSVSCRMSGRGEYVMKQDGTNGDNTDLHNCLKYTLGTVAKCANCGRRVGKNNDET